MSLVSRFAPRGNDCSARNGTPVASRWISQILALEVAAAAWQAPHLTGGKAVDTPHKHGESALSAPRIHGELLHLGVDVAQSTIARYMIRRRVPPSQGWRTFLRNQSMAISAADLFVQPTVGFKLYYVFVVIGHGRRELLHFAITSNPTADWLARQLTKAFPWDRIPSYLIRDNGAAYGQVFRRRLSAMGIRDRPNASRSP